MKYLKFRKLHWKEKMKSRVYKGVNFKKIFAETPLKIDSENNILVGRLKVASLVRKYGSPLFVFDKIKIQERCKKIKEAFINNTSDVAIYYAVKANGNIDILKTIREEISNVDVTSLGEMMAAEKAGFSYNKMILHGNAKCDKELNYAIKNDIFMIVADSINELFVINKLAKRFRKRVNIGLRINYGINITSPWDTSSETSKFGIPEKEVIEGYKVLKKLKNLNPLGLHSHLGSQICNVSSYLKVIQKMTLLVRDLFKIGVNVEKINIGGGFPIPYKFTNKSNKNKKKYIIDIDIIKWGQKIIKSFHKEFLKEKIPKQPLLIIEPGRYIVGSSGVLLTTVQNIKEYNNTNWIAVDAGCHTLPDCWTYDWYFECLPSKITYNEKKLKLYNIAGSLCDSGDIIGYNRYLPPPKRGGILIFLQVGAYQVEQQSNFNLRPRAGTVLIHNKIVQVIRQTDDLKDVVCLF